MSCRGKQETAKLRDNPKLFGVIETGSVTVFCVWWSEVCVMGITMVDENSSVKFCGFVRGYFSPFHICVQSNEL